MKFDNRSAQSVADAADLARLAKLFLQNAGQPGDFQLVTLTIDYNSAKPASQAIKVGSPFQSLFVMGVTHPELKAFFRPGTNAAFQSPLTIGDQTILNFGGLINGGFFHWDAQALTSDSSQKQYMYIMVSERAEFRSGSLAQIKGGVRTDIFGSFDQGSVVLGLGVAGALTAANGFVTNSPSSKYLLTWEGADTLYLGNSSVSNLVYGFSVQPNATVEWKNGQVLYGYSAAGGTVRFLREY